MQVALPGRVGWTTATSGPATVQGEAQWLPHLETLLHVPEASEKHGGAGRSREGGDPTPKAGSLQGQLKRSFSGAAHAPPQPLTLGLRPWPRLYRL